MSRAKRWVFTHNNPTEEHELHWSLFAEEYCEYLLYGREQGESGTPHLQGCFILHVKRRLSQLRGLVPQCHLEVMRGSVAQATSYCSKDGDTVDFGEPPTSQQGKRSDFEHYRDWIREQSVWPTDATIASQWPSLYGRYRTSVLAMRDLLFSQPELEEGSCNDWQISLEAELLGDPDDRTIEFLIDHDGGKGKTWFIRYYLTNYDDGQMLGIGKRDDIAHAIDPSKRVFFFNVPRGGIDKLQYTILEQLKDRLVFAPKYDSRTKTIQNKCHVIVFSNECPDMTAMSDDRYKIIHL